MADSLLPEEIGDFKLLFMARGLKEKRIAREPGGRGVFQLGVNHFLVPSKNNWLLEGVCFGVNTCDGKGPGRRSHFCLRQSCLGKWHLTKRAPLPRMQFVIVDAVLLPFL